MRLISQHLPPIYPSPRGYQRTHTPKPGNKPGIKEDVGCRETHHERDHPGQGRAQDAHCLPDAEAAPEHSRDLRESLLKREEIDSTSYAHKVEIRQPLKACGHADTCKRKAIHKNSGRNGKLCGEVITTYYGVFAQSD